MDEGPCSGTGGDTLAFLAEITSGQLHDLANVISVINELAGLQRDLLELQEAGQAADLAKQRTVIEKTQRHLQRGKTIIRSVREFVRGTESGGAAFDVKRKIAELVALAERRARLARVELAASFPPADVVVENNALLFQHALFRCLEAALASATGARKLEVRCRTEEGSVEVEVASADLIGTEGVEDRGALSRRLVNALGGEVRAVPGDGGGKRIGFAIPRTRGAGTVPEGGGERR